MIEYCRRVVVIVENNKFYISPLPLVFFFFNENRFEWGYVYFYYAYLSNVLQSVIYWSVFKSADNIKINNKTPVGIF